MAYKPQFGTKARDYLYSREKTSAYLAGRGDYPICPHCDQPVKPGQAWDEAHIAVPRIFGGKSTGVGHRVCNQLDNNQVVTPAFAKAERVRKKHIGTKGAGLGNHPMRCGRRSGERKTFGHGVQTRQKETHLQWRARRCFLNVEDIDGAIEVQP